MWSSEVESEGTFWVFLPRIKLSKPGLSAKIYKQRMWMFFFGHSSWKRTILWSTSRSVCNFHMGNINPKDSQVESGYDEEGSRLQGQGNLHRQQRPRVESDIWLQFGHTRTGVAISSSICSQSPGSTLQHSPLLWCEKFPRSARPSRRSRLLPGLHASRPSSDSLLASSFVLVACEALEVDCSRSLCDAIGSMSSCDSWPDANLMQAFAYVRNSKLLEVPPSFRHLLPHSSESGCCR